MKLSENGKQLIKSFESLRLTAYDDQRPMRVLEPTDTIRGKLTIGYGATKYADGSSIQIGDTITETQANEMFDQMIPRYEEATQHLITRNIIQHEFDAAVSFCYNAGTKYYNAGKMVPYDLWKHINEGLSGKAMIQYWVSLAVTSAGRKMNGLVNRRRSEVTFYQTGELISFT